MSNRIKKKASAPTKAAAASKGILEQFEAETFEKKVELFTQMKKYMQGEFERQFKAHEEKGMWYKNAYDNLLRQ